MTVKYLEKPYIYFKGIEIVKGSEIILAKKLMMEVIEELLNKEATIDDIIVILTKYKTKLLKGDVTADEITCILKVAKMPSEYKTLPQQVKMAVDRQKLGERFYVNMRVNFIIVESSPLKIIHPSEFKGKFDREHYWKTKVFNPTLRLLEAAYPKVDWKKHSSIYNELIGQRTLI